MKQPTLEEVKEYFKNAKTVFSVYGNKFEYDGNPYTGNSKSNEDSVYSDGNCLYSSSLNKFSEILTYKEKTFSITESQINELSNTMQVYDKLKEWYPEAFESEAKQLKIGTWYKKLNFGSFMFCFNGKMEFYSQYGFNYDGVWKENLGIDEKEINSYVEATEQEVFEALKNEAVKRGYKLGVLIKNAYGEELISKDVYSSYDYKLHQKGYFLYEGFVLFESGKWAEIIPTITLSEAEQQLKKKIIV